MAIKDILTDSLSNFLSKPGGFSSVAKLLTVNGKHKVKDVISKITDNPLEGLKLISENTDVDPKLITEIFKVIKISGLIPEPFNSLIPIDLQFATNVSEWFSDGTMATILSLIQKINTSGLSSLTDEEWKSIIKPLIKIYPEFFANITKDDLESLLKLVINQGIFNASNDELKNILQVINNIFKIDLSPYQNLIKLFISQPLGTFLSSENAQGQPQDNWSQIESLLSTINPDLKDKPIFQLLPKMFKALGDGFEKVEDFVNFVQELFPSFDLSGKNSVFRRYLWKFTKRYLFIWRNKSYFKSNS